jgi:PPOX class probable F420-dependent enzyme
MDIEAARDYLRANHRAVLATYWTSGTVQMTPVIAGIDGEGRVIISTRETAYKVRNLRRNPQASLCVFQDGFFGPWIQVDGPAEVLSLPDALEPLVDFYRRVLGEHPNWDEYRQAMVRERRVLLRLRIEHAGPDRQG